MQGKKLGRYISIRIGITMSVLMSFMGSFLGSLNASKNSGAPFLASWIPSLLVSLVVTMVIAVGLALILPMKRMNDGIAKAVKLQGLPLHMLQCFASDLIFTTIIALVMAFTSTALFVIPKNPNLSMKQLVPVALNSFAKSYALELLVAWIVLIIITPLIQKKAFAKFGINPGKKPE